MQEGKPVLGSAPSRLPLLTAAPARLPHHHRTPLHWKKNPAPKRIPLPQEAGTGLELLASPEERLEHGPQDSAGVRSPHPVLLLPDHSSILQHIYINKNEIFNFHFFKKRIPDKVLYRASSPVRWEVEGV